MPYLLKDSDKIKRILNKMGVRLTVKSHSTIAKFSYPKDPLIEKEILGTVYEVPCRDCKFTCINPTKWDLKSRLDDCKRDVTF